MLILYKSKHKLSIFRKVTMLYKINIFKGEYSSISIYTRTQRSCYALNRRELKSTLLLPITSKTVFHSKQTGANIVQNLALMIKIYAKCKSKSRINCGLDLIKTKYYVISDECRSHVHNHSDFLHIPLNPPSKGDFVVRVGWR